MRQRGHVGCKTLSLKLKSHEFKLMSKTETVRSPITSAKTALNILKRSLVDIMKKEKCKMRLIGVVLSNFTENPSEVSKNLTDFFNKTPDTSMDDDVIFEGMGEYASRL